MAIKKQSDDFIQYVLEQLGNLPGVTCKRIFGGHGLYQEETFFAVLHQGRLYFKTDSLTRKDFEKRQMPQFQPSEKILLKAYYEVPVDILENADELVIWARRSVNASRQGNG